MKNIKKKNIDPIKLIEGQSDFEKISQEMDVQVRFAVEVFEARKLKNWSQQVLAKKAETTQKVISKIESGDVNIGLDLLQRLARCLDLRLLIGNSLLVSDSKVQTTTDCAFKFPYEWIQPTNKAIKSNSINTNSVVNTTACLENK
jgi:ribosome-binding protein aMBF1 (putative translation factor)